MGPVHSTDDVHGHGGDGGSSGGGGATLGTVVGACFVVNLVTFAGLLLLEGLRGQLGGGHVHNHRDEPECVLPRASIELDDDAAGLAFAQGNDASYAYRADQLDGPETGLASLPMAKLPENTTSEAQP